MWRLIAGIVMISLSGVFVRLVDTPPTTSGVYRMLIGGLILAGWMLMRGERPALDRRGWTFTLLAAVAFAFDLFWWHRSILHVGVGLATLLANFQVFVLAITGVLIYREKLTARTLVAIPLGFAGLTLLVFHDWQTLGSDYRVGVVFGLLTALAYAAYILSLRHAQRGAGHRPIASIATLSLSCAVVLAVMAGIDGESLAISSLADAGWLVVYGVVAQVLGWVLISFSLPQIPASRVGLALLLQPVCAFVWDVLWFDRQLSAVELSGMGVALCAIYLGTQRRTARVSDAEAQAAGQHADTH